MKYLSVRVRNALVFHGYDADNQEILERVPEAPFADKLIALERLQSATEQYLLVSSAQGRALYWEYEGGLAALSARLAAAGLVVP